MISLPRGGLAMGVADDLDGIEMAAMMQTAYLSRIKARYRQRAALARLERDHAAELAAQFEAAAAEYTMRTFEAAFRDAATEHVQRVFREAIDGA